MNILEQMQAQKNENLIKLWRVCDQTEAEATVKMELAGGKTVDLKQKQPTEESVIEQVGNNEGVVGASGGSSESDKLEKLKKILEAKNKGNIQIHGNTKERTVVEYSTEPARQFKGTLVEIMVNRTFSKKGSNLNFEKGIILQVGTPLHSAKIVQ
ncbi:hypothetical protein [Tenacibaculum sp. nBUS_03]|uniref:hypothetical protein n=1 Tax=Tenacibaculum sp. nBUS_03 TaxID=3395320 RepID=UPI003EC0D539